MMSDVIRRCPIPLVWDYGLKEEAGMTELSSWESANKVSPDIEPNAPRCLAEGTIPWMTGHVEWLETSLVIANRRLLRRHKSKKIKSLATSMKQVGFTMPLLVDGQGKLICGEARLAAALALELDVVPVIRITHLTETQIRILRIADNRFGERAEWDEEFLALELQSLLELEVEIELTGFEVPEIDQIIEIHLPRTYDRALDDCPSADTAGKPISNRGDLWVCNNHRVLCGDACSETDMKRLMTSEAAHALITDSPYNLKIEGVVSGKGKHKHKDFLEASGEMTDQEFLDFQVLHLETASQFCDDRALIYSFVDWRSVDILLAAGKRVLGDVLNICVWKKSNAGMGSFYRSQHEFVVVFKKGKGPYRNNVELGQYGRNRSNVWEYEGANSFNSERRKELALHPTVKPARMIADIMLDCTKPNDIVLDPFLGSGTALIAAEDAGRRAFGMELDARYVDVIVRRWQEFTGEEAILEASGQTFDEVVRNGRAPLLLPPPSSNKGGDHDG